jgi:hypothetical protein
MIWEGMALDCHLSDADLARVLAVTFDLPAESMAFIDALDELLMPNVESAHMVIHRWTTKGEFPLQVDIYLHDRDARRRADARDQFDAVQQVAALSGCRIVVSDLSPDPYVWLEVHPSGAVDSVEVNADRLDDDDELVVESRRPFAPARGSSARSGS